MFPAGAPGVGLVILRLCAAALLIRNAERIATLAFSWWGPVALCVVVVAICIGVFTPAACIASSLVQIVLLIWAAHGDPFEVISSVGVTWALLLLGPGAFSVDGRIFGRRRIHLSNSR
jgi:hypothetical protein